MHECLDGIATAFPIMEQDQKREFEMRLAESSTLAFRVAFSVLRRREDAEDIAQEAFVKAYRNFRSLRDRERFRAWLVRMTWRMAIDRVRSNRRRATRELADGTGRSTPEPTVLRERSDDLRRAIDVLPEKLRIVIVLAGIEGHDVREVAALLSVPEGTVKSRLFLARQRLKELLK